MSQANTFSDHHIRQTIDALKADGQNITPWAVQSRLGGGDFLRIQQLIEQFPTANIDSTLSSSLSSPSATSSFQQSSDNTKKTATIQTVSKKVVDQEDILDKQMPAGIEASMYDMQTTLGKMANQLWTDAASNAENQVRGKLFSAQQALKEAQQVQAKTEHHNNKMQSQISQLTQDISQLDSDYKEASESLAHETSISKQAQQQCSALQKNVDTLQAENQSLEQEAFNANIKVAKAEGLAEIAKEQLTLAKQSEKQAQKSLNRAEHKIDSLNKEMHDASQALREEIRDRLAQPSPIERPPEQPPAFKPQMREYPPQELPQPSAASIASQEQPPLTHKPVQQEVAQTPAIPPPPIFEPASIQEQPIGVTKPQAGPQTNNATMKKTRSLSDKLFDRKKRNSISRNR